MKFLCQLFQKAEHIDWQTDTQTDKQTDTTKTLALLNMREVKMELYFGVKKETVMFQL